MFYWSRVSAVGPARSDHSFRHRKQRNRRTSMPLRSATAATLVRSAVSAKARLLSTTALASDKVGFIGLGNMGMPMALNLIKAGHELVVCDQNAAAVQQLCHAHGVQAAATPAQVAATPGLSAIITMLPSSRAVLGVYTGPAGILHARGGVTAPLLIDSSTVDPETSRAVAEAAVQSVLAPGVAALGARDEHSSSGGSSSRDSASGGSTSDSAGAGSSSGGGGGGVGPMRASPAVVDAPVSGGVPGATAGLLTFMVGGGHAAVAAAQTYLDAMGKRAMHCGGPGAGQAAKVCNNLVLGISMAAVAEGLALGCRLGLDPALLSTVFNSSSARCWSSDTYSPAPGVMEGVPSARGYQGGFAAELMCKDLRLALDAAKSAGAPLPLGEAALGLYQQVAQTEPKLDFSAVYELVYDGKPSCQQ